MSHRQPNERPYASADGFYPGDRIELSAPLVVVGRSIQKGRVDFVHGSHSHTVIVVLDDGRRCYATDSNLTRLAE